MKYRVESYPEYDKNFKTEQAAQKYAAKLRKRLLPAKVKREDE